MNAYKAINIKYDTDGEAVPGLPVTLVVSAEHEGRVVDAISDKTGWCVESVDDIVPVPTYESLCSKFSALEEETEQALLDLLASRDIESINIKAYADNEDIDKLYFPQTDKNGYGVNVSIDSIRKDKKGKWIADVVDEDDDDWGTLRLNRTDFPAGVLVDVLGLVERIFECADDEHDGHVLAYDEEFEDVED